MRKKHNMASQKCFLGMAGWKGDNLSATAPHLSTLMDSHTLSKYTPSAQSTPPLLFAGLISSHSANGACKSQAFLLIWH